jgi:hypothetical protein
MLFIELMLKPAKIINGLVICIWFTLLSVLLYKNYAGIPLEKSVVLKEAFGKETYWYDIYAEKKKVGFASTTFEKAGNEIIIKHEREMKVIKNGEEKILIEKLKCLCDQYYAIRSFEFTSYFQNESGVKVRGEVGPDTIIFFLESAEKRKVHKIPKRDFYFPVTLIPVLVQQKPSPDMTFTVPFLNMASLSIYDVRVLLEEIRPVKVEEDILSVYKFRAENAVWWANERGLIIKEKSPIGITLYSQVEKFAKNPADRILFDYTSLPFFKSNKPLQNPETLKTLKVKVNSFPLQAKLYENTPVTLEDNTLTIKKINNEILKDKSYKLPYEKEQLHKYLSPDTWVKSDYKPLNDTGRIYARSNNYDGFLLTNYLTNYLFNLVRTRPMFFLSDSKSFLESLSGDYLERTVMFATYARSGGLPARLVGGLVYLKGYFYFHTWPEVWLDQWVPADPTFVQFPADVTHIPLREGTLQDITSIIDDLKSTTIEILEAS